MKRTLFHILLCLTFAGTASQPLSAAAKHEKLFGPNVFIYGPQDDMSAIGQEVNALHEKMFHDQFSPQRYAVLFLPGDYRQAGLLRVPYYMQMAGLGRTPYEVKVSNVHTPAPLGNDNGTCTFWRSLENLSVIGPETYDEDETFKWAVSQAAPMRRIYSERTLRTQWRRGWVSGGYAADCYFVAPAGSDHQQQWYYRNSVLNKGRGEFKEVKYNYCFQGVELGPDADRSTYRDNWDEGGNVTFIPTTPVIREKPFLFVDKNGRYKVFRPALRRDCKGLSYTRDDMGEGDVFDVKKDFFVVKEGTSAREMNRQLARGKHLLFTPGMFTLEEPLRITRPGTIVLGLGIATLIPGEQNPETAILVDDVDGVSVASLMFDAHYSSRSLLCVGQSHSDVRHTDNPILLADLFFRVGGFRPAPVHVDQTVVLNANDVIGDHFWIWRADHGVRGSVGWNVNTSPNGLVVNGNYVTIYGLFNEHFQEYQTLWNGEHGRTYFYQCETPYDAPNQAAYMSEQGKRDGYAAYKVADHVQNHFATAFGIYDVLHNDIRIESSVEVPDNSGIRLRHVCNNCLSNQPKKGFGFVVNNLVRSTYSTFRDNRTYLVDFPADYRSSLPHAEASPKMKSAFSAYLQAIDREKLNLHSVIVMQHGKVLAEHWLNGGSPGEQHILNSVSKTFTSTAVGLAVGEGLLHLDDKVISFFPDKLPAEPSDKLRRMTVRHLLTMSCGHDTDPTGSIRNGDDDWVERFLAYPILHEPGTRFCYNSLGTYVLSAIVQKVTGHTVLDYLTPRLFAPLGIKGMRWEQSPQGICCGGWGLYLKSEDLAKMGQLLLQKGKWEGRQLIPAEWVEQASSKQVDCTPAGMKPADAEKRGLTPDNNDWVNGYGFQMWRCRHNAFRADGASGQYIIVLPDQDAVVINTAMLGNMWASLELIWEHLLPELEATK